MGLFDFLRRKPSEQFSQQWSIGGPAFAAWLLGQDADTGLEAVTPYTVLGLSAVLRSVQVISGTIAGLPLKTYERQGDERKRVPSVFDDPYPGIEGMTPFAWVETVMIHLLLWREAFLWHESIDTQSGQINAYRPIIPSSFGPVKRVNGKLRFTYRDDTGEQHEVGSEQVTYIPGPSLDGVCGHPLLHAARAVFSAAMSGDKTAQRILGKGIRIAGLVTPRDGEEDFDKTEGDQIKQQLTDSVVGTNNAGGIALINRKLDLQKWQATNIEAQWDETRMHVLMEIEQIFGMPPHLLADTVRQTSWGTGVAEQNRGFAVFTLMDWTSRVEQTLTRRLPNGKITGQDGEFLEFDYKGLLQGTPAEEIELLLKQTGGKAILAPDEARKILNLPPLTPAQKRELGLTQPPAPVAPAAPPTAPTPLPVPNGAAA